MNEALAEHCTDITEARTERGEEPGYRLYTARWAPTDPQPSKTPTAAPRWDPKPAADPAAPFLPLQPGEWDIPRSPLRPRPRPHRRTRPTARLRTARRTGRAMYGPAAHQTTAPHKHLLLFAEEQPPTLVRPAADLTALRTDLEALELTTDQIRRTGTAFATVGDEARRRVRKPAHPNPEPAHQDPGGAPHAHQPDEQRMHRPHQHRTGQGPGALG